MREFPWMRSRIEVPYEAGAVSLNNITNNSRNHVQIVCNQNSWEHFHSQVLGIRLTLPIYHVTIATLKHLQFKWQSSDYWKHKAVPQLRWLVAGFPQRRPGFELGVWSCWICGGQGATGAGVLRVLRFPKPTLISPTAPLSHLSSGTGRIDQLMADVRSGLSLTSTQEEKETESTAIPQSNN
jgi:hypothetical protein